MDSNAYLDSTCSATTDLSGSNLKLKHMLDGSALRNHILAKKKQVYKNVFRKSTV